MCSESNGDEGCDGDGKERLSLICAQRANVMKDVIGIEERGSLLFGPISMGSYRLILIIERHHKSLII